MNCLVKYLILLLIIFNAPKYFAADASNNDPSYNRHLITQHLENNPDSALHYINKDLAVAKLKGDQDYQAWLELHKGLLFMFLNNNKKATEHIFSSIQLYERLKDTLGFARGYLNYGNITSNNDSSRLFYYKEGLRFYRLKDNSAGTVKGLNNIGMFFLDNEQLDSAQHYVNEALTLSKEMNHAEFIATSLINIAILEYKGKNAIDTAIAILKNVIEMPGINERRRIVVHGTHLLSQLYFKKQEYDSSRVYIERTLALTQTNFFYLRSQAFDMLSAIYENNGQYRLAQLFQGKSDSIKISIIRNDNRNLINLLERENELRLNQERIKKLDAEVQKSFYIKLLLSILLGLAIVLGLTITQLQRTKSQKEKAILQAREKQAEAEQKLLQSELKHTQLEKEYLNDRLSFTKGELSSYTANFIQHNNIIHEIHAEIDEVRKSISNANGQQRLRELSIQLNQLINRDDARRILVENALEVNNELFFELKNKYPSLTEKDMHLISFIMLGLSSKEIADIYNIEPESVHTKRYRLRKKLGLNNEESFEEFLNRNFRFHQNP